MFNRLKRIGWRLLGEYKEYRDFGLRMIPGELGFRLRRRHFRKRFAACGKGLRIGHNVRILNPEHLHAGENVEFGWDAFVEAGGVIRVGDNSMIGPGSKVWSNNHRFEDADKPILEQGLEPQEVIIENDVWIGADCFIKAGVRIGRGSVLSAGTVLSKSVPAFAVVAGNPGRVVGWRRPPAQAGPRSTPEGAEWAQA